MGDIGGMQGGLREGEGSTRARFLKSRDRDPESGGGGGTGGDGDGGGGLSSDVMMVDRRQSKVEN
jgi:hypothetical protein